MSDFVFAFMDCEFGGLDPELHDITEIAIVLTDYRLAELASAEWKVRARPTASAGRARRSAAIRPKPGPTRRRSARSCASWRSCYPRASSTVPAGQNVRMDVQFLERAYRSCEIPYPFDYHVIDLATLFYGWSLVAGEEVSALSRCARPRPRRGCSRGRVPHRAMADTRLTLETFRHYVGPPGSAHALRCGRRLTRRGRAPPPARARPLRERPLVDPPQQRQEQPAREAARREAQRGLEVDQDRAAVRRGSHVAAVARDRGGRRRARGARPPRRAAPGRRRVRTSTAAARDPHAAAVLHGEGEGSMRPSRRGTAGRPARAR